MTTIHPMQLENLCNDILQPQNFKDYCPNGLQVDADVSIQKIVTGVTACQALIDKAIDARAQAILVHHGYFWKGESEALTHMKGKRIRTLLQNNISLLAYHLPLDAHPTLGNNAVLAHQLDLNILGGLYPDEKYPVGNIAQHSPINAEDFYHKLWQTLQRKPLHIATHNKPFSRIALCTGGAQDMIEQAYQMDCDAFISGEISERTTHMARELGIDYFACGHHATERGGVQALGEYLSDEHGLSVQFIDIDNPA